MTNELNLLNSILSILERKKESLPVTRKKGDLIIELDNKTKVTLSRCNRISLLADSSSYNGFSEIPQEQHVQIRKLRSYFNDKRNKFDKDLNECKAAVLLQKLSKF